MQCPPPDFDLALPRPRAAWLALIWSHRIRSFALPPVDTHHVYKYLSNIVSKCSLTLALSECISDSQVCSFRSQAAFASDQSGAGLAHLPKDCVKNLKVNY